MSVRTKIILPQSTLEQVQELYHFLQGIVPERTIMKNPPQLSEEVAFNVIWFLQEHMGVLPCNYERCSVCGSLYDTMEEGIYSGDDEYEMEAYIEAGYNFSKDDLKKHFCGSCAP